MNSTEVKVDQVFFESNILEIIKSPSSFSLKLNDEAYAVVAKEIAARLTAKIVDVAQRKLKAFEPAEWTRRDPKDISNFTKWMMKTAHEGQDPLKTVCAEVCANSSWPYWSDDFKELVSFVGGFHEIKDRPGQVAGFSKLWSVYESTLPTFVQELKVAVDAPTKRVVKKTKAKKKAAKKIAKKVVKKPKR